MAAEADDEPPDEDEPDEDEPDDEEPDDEPADDEDEEEDEDESLPAEVVGFVSPAGVDDEAPDRESLR